MRVSFRRNCVNFTSLSIIAPTYASALNQLKETQYFSWLHWHWEKTIGVTKCQTTYIQKVNCVHLKCKGSTTPIIKYIIAFKSAGARNFTERFKHLDMMRFRHSANLFKQFKELKNGNVLSFFLDCIDIGKKQ